MNHTDPRAWLEMGQVHRVACVQDCRDHQATCSTQGLWTNCRGLGLDGCGCRGRRERGYMVH